MKKIYVFCFTLLAFSLHLLPQEGGLQPYRNPGLPAEARVCGEFSVQ